MTFYQAANEIEFEYAYIDQDGVAIDISSATAVVLYLLTPVGRSATVTGSYSATASKNLAIATTTNTTIIDNDFPRSVQGLVQWQFKVTLASGEIIWGPSQKLMMGPNLG